MSDDGIARLQQKLKAAQNEKGHGYESYLRAQYYENLTKGQYSGEQRPRLSSYFDVSRDSLNPQINLNLLRQRLRTIEMYKNRTTPQQRYWVRYVLENLGARASKYRYNYLLKFVFFWTFVGEVRHMTHLHNVSIMRFDQSVVHVLRTAAAGSLFAATMLFI